MGVVPPLATISCSQIVELLCKMPVNWPYTLHSIFDNVEGGCRVLDLGANRSVGSLTSQLGYHRVPIVSVGPLSYPRSSASRELINYLEMMKSSIRTDGWKVSVLERSSRGLRAEELEINKPCVFDEKSNKKRTREVLNIPQVTLQQLQRIAGEVGVSLFSCMLSCFVLLLHGYTDRDDVEIVVPVSHFEEDTQFNLVSCPVVVRSNISDNPTFVQLIGRVHRAVLDSLNGSSGQVEYPALFTLAPCDGFKFLPLPDHEALSHGAQETRFDIAMAVQARGYQGVILECASTPSETGVAQRMARSFDYLLKRVSSEPQSPVARLGVVDIFDERELHAWSHQNRAVYPRKDWCGYRLFEEQARLYPHNTALVWGEDEVSMTYTELDTRATEVARELRASKGAGFEWRNQVVGLCVENSSWKKLVAILAVWKSGAAYLPLDPMMPDERLKYMIKNANAEIILCDTHLRERISQLQQQDGLGHLIVMTMGDEGVGDEQPLLVPQEPFIQDDPHNLAYVLYTSGSTGLPKGVAVEHLSLTNFVHAIAGLIAITQEDRVVSISPYTFDVSLHDIGVSLFFGASLHLRPAGVYGGHELASFISRHKITIMSPTPSILGTLVDFGVESLRVINCIGEVLPLPLVKRFAVDGCEFYNMYGPTETTVFSTGSKCQSTDERVTIGRALPNYTTYILNKFMQCVPVGVAGELHIGGLGVARGYINNEPLTAARFVANPFGEGRLYKTGDVAKLLESGDIEYIGRVDFQVKLRGVRIELGEIETVMADYPGVKGAVVLMREDNPGNKTLVGFVSPVTIDVAALKAHMAAKLPTYMLPQAVVPLAEHPLNSHGKVDRKALHAMPVARVYEPVIEAKPCTQLETDLVSIWGEVLGLPSEAIGIHSCLFDYGGHSLTATQIASRIYTKLGVEVPIRVVLEQGGVASLASFISQDGPQSSHGSLGPQKQQISKVPRLREAGNSFVDRQPSFGQERMWLLHSLYPLNTQYNLSDEYWVNAKLDSHLLHSCLCQLVQRHEVLRTTVQMEQGRLVQRIHDVAEVLVSVLDLRGVNDGVSQLTNIATEHANIPFDLSKDCLIRCSVVTLHDTRHLVLLSLHHIATDGWSTEIIMNELMDLYDGRVLQPLRIQYSDFAEWQRGWLQGDTLEKQAQYWLDILGGVLPLLQLPLDRPRPALMTNSGATFSFEIPPETAKGAKKVAGEAGVSLFSYLLSCFIGLLHRISGQDDVIVGIPVANRNNIDVEKLIGFFVNTLAIRTDLSDDPPFTQLIKRVHSTVLGALDHQDMPFEMLVRRLKVDRNTSTSPIFQAMFTLQQRSHHLSAGQGIYHPPYHLVQITREII